MDRREFLKGTCAGLVAPAVTSDRGDAGEERKPNLVVILTDDQGWGDLSCTGNTNLETPNVDSLCRDGVTLDRFYVCPVCAPTRAELLTGRYHSRSGVRGVTMGAERMDLDETTIGEVFHAAGYATGAFGKWHNGTQYPYHPNGRGFQEFYGFCSGHWGQYFDPILEHNGEITRGKGFIIDDLTDHALDFIGKNKEHPFLCYVPYNSPHSPFQVPDRFYDKFREKKLKMLHRDPDKEDIETTKAALAMCENIDWNVGRILEKLEELDLSQDTIVVYFSDNGPNSWRWNGGMRGRKGSTDEGGVRAPCFIRWPGRLEAGQVVSEITGAIDLLPTLTELAGLPLSTEKPLDGKSLVPLLSKRRWKDRQIFSHYNGRVSVRTQEYRLDHKGRLYDMEADPGQERDVSDQLPKIHKRLREAVAEWRTDALSKPVSDERPFTVGYREFPQTVLPARDGIPGGGIQRSARAPNCSFFTHWTSVEDTMVWHVDVKAEGEYEAFVYYTCPAHDVGATLELSLGDAQVRGKITEAHDPPLVGASFDRVPRGGESYVKEFRPLSLGTMKLKKGRGDLTLKAVDVPGESVMDVRGVVLTLK